MSDIPLARRLLAQIAPDVPPQHQEAFNAAMAALHRRPPGKPRGPIRKRRVDPALAAAIRAYIKVNPSTHLQDVATLFGTGLGRVSEALHHDR
jgi:hypothetical protein